MVIGAIAAMPVAGQRIARLGSRANLVWLTPAFCVAMVVLVAAVPALAYVGARTVLDSNDGRLVNRVTDPAAPGWEAIVEPTPTDMVATIDADGQLLAVSVLILTGQSTGAVLQIPSETLVPLTIDGTETLGISASFAWSTSGLEGLRARIGELLNLEFSDAQAVTAAEWAALVGPAGTLAVDSLDAAVDETGRVVYPKGSFDLAPAEVATYLAVRARNESEVARLVRVEAFWQAWLEALGSAGVQALPAPADQGLGLFLGTLAAGQVRFETLPVSVEPGVDGGSELYRPQRDEIEAVVGELVPFPRGAPGKRSTVKVLDGTGQLDHGVAAAVVLGAAGAQVEVIGNASAFDAATTEIVYYDSSKAAEAELLRDALGFGDVRKSDQKSAIDIMVVLGQDALALDGSTAVPGTNAGGATSG